MGVLLMFKAIIIFFSIITALFLGSCSEDEDVPAYTTSGVVIDVPDGVPVSGSAFKSRGENAWGFVRQSATWGDANSQIVDQLLVSLLNSGLLQQTGTFTDTSSTINNQSMTIKLTTGGSFPVSTASSFSGTLTFSKKFEIWRNSDNAKALELFFDEATALGTNGVLMYYQLNVLAPDEFNGDDVVVESYTFESSEGRKQTYSWSGGAIVANGSGEAGRVILEEMDGGTVFCFKAVVKMSGTLNWCPGSNNEYYSLGYTQRLGGSGETTAKFGYTDNNVDNVGQLCASSNTLIYGLFNSSGFVSDGNSSVSTDYPATTRVDGLFGELNTAGAGTWDDSQKATIDGLNIQFVDSSAP